MCSREDYRLSYGRLHADAIECSPHGSPLSQKTGVPLDKPADTPVATLYLGHRDGWSGLAGLIQTHQLSRPGVRLELM
jgi:hypothetical protein